MCCDSSYHMFNSGLHLFSLPLYQLECQPDVMIISTYCGHQVRQRVSALPYNLILHTYWFCAWLPWLLQVAIRASLCLVTDNSQAQAAGLCVMLKQLLNDVWRTSTLCHLQVLDHIFVLCLQMLHHIVVLRLVINMLGF